MNQPLQHSQSACVSLPVDVTCNAPSACEQRLVCIAEEVPAATAPRADSISSALTSLRQWQPLSRLTRCAHASAWVTLDGDLRTVREDVGRHNSLDKLVGAMLREGLETTCGFCLITSRCSFEMVQKAIAAGFPTLVSAGSPTALAIRCAQTSGVRHYSLSRVGEPLQLT